MARVAPETLVASISRQGHGYFSARFLAERIMEQGRGDPKGLVKLLGNVLKASRGEVGVYAKGLVIGAEVFRDPGCRRCLVVDPAFGPEANREGAGGGGVTSLSLDAGHHGHHEARVDSAGEKGSQGNVGNHVLLDDFPEQHVETVGGFVDGAEVGLGQRFKTMKALDRDPVSFHHELVSRVQARDPLERRARRRHVEIGEVARQGAQVFPAFEARVDQEGLDLGSKNQGIPGAVGRVERSVEEGLDPAGIPGEQHALTLAVPQAKGVHALDPVQEPIAVFLVEMKKDFGVAVGVKRVPAFFQVGS